MSRGVWADGIILGDSHSEGGSAHPQSVIYKLSERMSAASVQGYRPAPEELFRSLIPACLLVKLQEYLQPADVLQVTSIIIILSSLILSLMW